MAITSMSKFMHILPHLFITVSLVYHNFTLALSQPASTFVLLALVYDIFTHRLSQHSSGLIVSTHSEEPLVYTTSSFDVVECSDVGALEPVLKQVDDHSTLCVESGDEKNKCRNIGCTREEEEWRSTLAWKLFEERHYKVVEGEEGMDSLWEVFEADSTKSRRMEVVVKNKEIEKKSGEVHKYYGCNEEDEDGDQVEMRNGCLQGFKCCRLGGGKMMMMRRGRSSIVKISKPLKMISWWRHFKRHAKRNRFSV